MNGEAVEVKKRAQPSFADPVAEEDRLRAIYRVLGRVWKRTASRMLMMIEMKELVLTRNVKYATDN